MAVHRKNNAYIADPNQPCNIAWVMCSHMSECLEYKTCDNFPRKSSYFRYFLNGILILFFQTISLIKKKSKLSLKFFSMGTH